MHGNDNGNDTDNGKYHATDNNKDTGKYKANANANGKDKTPMQIQCRCRGMPLTWQTQDKERTLQYNSGE